MVWYRLTERDLNINKIQYVDRVIHFLTHLHNCSNQCTSLRLVTAVAAVFIMKVNLMRIIKVGNSGCFGIHNESKLDNQKISHNFSDQSSYKCS